MRKKSAASFTLVELLVVIAIIAILASMLLPALNSARGIAKGIKCVAQLKQTVVAGLVYAGDYNNQIPLKVAQGSSWVPWSVAFRDYKYITPKALLCPSIPAPADYTWYFYKTYGIYFGGESAAVTERFGGCASILIDGNAKNLSLNKAQNISSFVIYADTGITWNGPYPGYADWVFAMSAQAGDNSGVYLIHSQGNGAAVAFLDGHAGIKPPRELAADSMLHVYTSASLMDVRY